MDIVIYFALLLALALSLIAQVRVSTTFRRYSRVPTRQGMRAEDVARLVLDTAGCTDVVIERTRGNLTDHYDPRTKTLRLSDSTFGNASAAAVGVACHEAGHAIQHREEYLPLKLRSVMVPATTFASRAWYFIFMIGLLFLFVSPDMTLPGLDFSIGYYVILAGIALFSVTTLFQLVTLPCEFNASSRALRAMRETGYFEKSELAGARQVLSAAAMTYISAALVSILQLLRLISMVRRNR